MADQTHGPSPAARPAYRIAARWILALALIGYLLLAVAQQGGIGSNLTEIPERPLLFPRHQVFGLDLRNRSSVEAVDWSAALGQSQLALVLLPVDAEIVAALSSDADRAAAITSITTLIGSDTGPPIGLCLRQPVTPLSTQELATAVVDAVRSIGSNRIAYISTCDPDNGSWHNALVEELDLSSDAGSGSLVPLTSGAEVGIEVVDGFSSLQPSEIRDFSGANYTVPVIPVSAPLSPEQIESSVEALTDAAQLALIGIRPEGGVDIQQFIQSVSGTVLDSATLPEGFSRFDAPGVTLGGPWQGSDVGNVLYAQTTEAGATMRASFIGTSIWLVGLFSPDGGSIRVGIDETEPTTESVRDKTISFEVLQAHDGAIPVANDLPASHHTITIESQGGQIALSGIVVRGQQESLWTRLLSSVSLIVIAIVALIVLGLSEVHLVRTRFQPPPREVDTSTHPREFRRDY